MNFFKLAFRCLFRKGEHTYARIISLAAGLAFGVLLLTEVFYFYSFDSFYPDANRIYIVQESFPIDNNSDKLGHHPRVSGAVAPGLKAEVPGIEAACRLNSIGENVFYTDDNKSYKARFSLSDEFLFDVLPRPIIHGNPSEILQTPMQCMVSSEIAQNMGGDVVGKLIELKQYKGKKLVVAGVFQALPENTNYEYDVLISMVSTNAFTWDGTNNWLGNDRYYACVKVAPGVMPESLAPAVRKMQIKHQDIEQLEEKRGGMVLSYSFNPIRKIRSEAASDMILILSTIAIAVLFVSIMNYILLTLSVLVNRAKSSAIHKTCGAQAINLQKLIFTETFLLFFISILGAVLLVVLLKPLAESLLEHRLSSLLNPIVLWPIIGILFILVLGSSYLPGRFFSNIPVATAFRSYKQKRNKWKLALLSMQFVGASFILTLMIVVSLQFDNMKNADHGYKTKGIYYGSTAGMEGNKLATVLHELRALPQVKKVGLGFELPIDGASGNNVYSPDGKKELFNVADFYQADENYLAILGIKDLAGHNFSSKNAAPNDMLISRKGAELLRINNGWNDGVVGKQIRITEHGTTNICGVFPDFTINSMASPDIRPSAFFYLPEEDFIQKKKKSPAVSFNILIEVQEGMEAGMLAKITDVFNLGMPQNDANIKSLESELQNNYASERGFRNAMMAGNAVILLITIIGLLGYTSNEASRRRKELAIRRINGAKLQDILRAFILDLEYIAIPAVLLGLVGAWFIINRWMQNFSSKISLHWGIFVSCSLFILIMVAIIAAINYSRTANHNPVEALRYE